jgi:transcriptional regulator with XRE-family HTH domain
MKSWSELRADRLNRPAARDGYTRARRAYEIGRRVRELREEAGLSQAQLATRAGTSQAAIARLEAGGAEPRISTLDRIGAVFGVTLRLELVRTAAPGDPTPRSRPPADAFHAGTSAAPPARSRTGTLPARSLHALPRLDTNRSPGRHAHRSPVAPCPNPPPPAPRPRPATSHTPLVWRLAETCSRRRTSLPGGARPNLDRARRLVQQVGCRARTSLTSALRHPATPTRALPAGLRLG